MNRKTELILLSLQLKKTQFFFKATTTGLTRCHNSSTEQTPDLLPRAALQMGAWKP